jgi:hypothetical protein
MSTSWTEKLRQALGLEPGESKYTPVNQDGALEKQEEPVSSRKRLVAKIAASVLLVWLLLFGRTYQVELLPPSHSSLISRFLQDAVLGWRTELPNASDR